MKKAIATILFFLYLGAAVGMPVNVHYCMGNFVKYSVGYAEAIAKCPKCGMEQKKGCCEDKQATIKAPDTPLTLVQPLAAKVFIFPFVPAFTFASAHIYKAITARSTFAEPRRKPPPLYKLFCVFLI